MSTLAKFSSLFALGVAFLITSSVASPAGGSGAPPKHAELMGFYANKTLLQQTAKLSVTGYVESQGRSIEVRGSGAANFSTGTASMDLRAQTVTVREIVAAGSLYLSVAADGSSVDFIAPGKTWVAFPFGTSGTQTGDPAAQLSMLESPDIRVHDLGESEVGSRSVEGYAITISPQAVKEGMQRFAASAGLSTDEESSLGATAKELGPQKLEVWVGAGGTIREVEYQLSAPGLLSIRLKVSFEEFGAPVHISVPQSDETVSDSRFVHRAEVLDKATSAGTAAPVVVWFDPGTSRAAIANAEAQVDALSGIYGCTFRSQLWDYHEAKRLLSAREFRALTVSTMPSSYRCIAANQQAGNIMIRDLTGQSGVMKASFR